MKHQDYNSNRSNLHRFCAFALPATMLLLTVQLATANSPATSHGVVTYGFQGRVTAVEPGSRIFPGASVGAPVLGQFTIDYDVTGTPSSLELRTSGSPNFRFSGLIGGQAFASASTAYQSVSVGNNTIRNDFVTLNFPAGVPTNLERLVLEFTDSRGFAITEPILPASAAAFNAFPTVVLSGFSNVWMGSYSIDVSIFPITLNTIEFLRQPSNTVVFLNSSATFSLEARATVNGTNFQGLAYQWQRLPPNGENWLNSDWINVQGATNSSYTTPPIETPAPGNPSFRCAITAGEATSISYDAILTVERADCPPPTVTAVSADSQRQEVTIEFSLPVHPPSATETFGYVIYDSVTLEYLSFFRGSMRDARTAVMEIDRNPPFQSGATYEMVINDVMTDSSDSECSLVPIASDTKVRFTVPPCLQITRQPRSQTVPVFCIPTFEVAARWLDNSFPGRLKYQWSKNGELIEGATNTSYTTPPVHEVDNGSSFHAVVSSTCGSISSTNALLTVSPEFGFPKFIGVRPGPIPDTVVLSFESGCGPSERPMHYYSSLDPLNYQFNGGLAFEPPLYPDCSGPTVIIFTSPQQAGTTYAVTAVDVQDEAGNVMNSRQTLTFTAPTRIPIPFGTLRFATEGKLTMLEWSDGGILQAAATPTGPWTDQEPAFGRPVFVMPPPCAYNGVLAPPSRFYRVRWNAP